jgi:hypothetical protein
MQLRLLKRATVQIVTSLVLLLVATIGYAFFAEAKAERKARDFCRSIAGGQSTKGLLERGLEAGGNVRMTRWMKSQGADDWLPVTFSGFMPLSRHICSIEAKDEKVVRGNYLYLD